MKRKERSWEEGKDRKNPSSKRKRKKKNIQFFHHLEINSFLDISGIQCISEHKNFAAISRFDSSIEIWYIPMINKKRNMEKIIHLKTIPPKKNTTVNKIIWLNSSYIMTCGLHGYVTIFSLRTLLPIAIQESFGGAIYDMCSYQTKDGYIVVIGGYDGKVRMFKLTCNFLTGTFEFELLQVFIPSQNVKFDKKKFSHIKHNSVTSVDIFDDRILSHKSGNFPENILVGTFNGVYCYNVSKSSNKKHFTQYKFHTFISPNTLITKVKYVYGSGKGTFLIGDSNGTLHFCDTKFGTILYSYKYHKLDIMDITLSNTFEQVISVGIDGQIILYELQKQQTKTKDTKNEFNVNEIFDVSEDEDEDIRFMFVNSRRPSFHDLYSVTIVGDHIIFGGVDTRLIWMDMSQMYGKEQLEIKRKKMIFPGNRAGRRRRIEIYEVNGGIVNYYGSRKMLRIAQNLRLFLSYNNNFTFNLLHIPKYSNVLNDSNAKSRELKIINEPTHVLSTKTNSFSQWGVRDYDISESAKYVVFSTYDCVNVFVLSSNENEKQMAIKMVVNLCEKYKVSAGHFVRFIRDEIIVITSLNNDGFEVFHIPKKKIIKKVNFPLKKAKLKGYMFTNTVMDVLVNDKWLVMVYGSSIKVYDVNKFDLHWEFNVNVKKSVMYKAKFLNSNVIAILMIGDDCTRFDIAEKKCLEKEFTRSLLSDTIPVCGIPREIISYNERSIQFSTNKSVYTRDFEANKTKYVDLTEKQMSTTIVDVQKVDEDEIVVLKNLWVKQMCKLPDVVWRKRFGV